MPERPSPHAPALAFLRTAVGWSQARLARFFGLGKEDISKYERGDKALTRETLDFLAEPIAPPEAVDVLLVAYDLIFPEPPEEVPSPVAFSPEELRAINRAAMVVAHSTARRAAKESRAGLILRRKLEKVDAARQEAQECWARLKADTGQDRLDLVKVFPEFRSWALAERVSHESERMAAHDVKEALELADLALSVAERVLGEENWRSRVQGYCWAHVANARRVANDHAGADEAFARAWDLWRAGAKSDPELLAEWRLLDLEASLRRAQRRFSESLGLLDQARDVAGGDPFAIGRILLKKEHAFEQMGDIENALSAVTEAERFVKASGDARLLFALRFKSANHLCHLGRFEEAVKLLPEVRKLAVQQGNELDLLRLLWLESKGKAGQGQRGEALAGLEQVRQDFTARSMPYDAALSGLDLSVLLLKEGRTGEVKELALAMGWIFKAQGITREALAALQLFCSAASQETATVELARKVIADIEQARRSAPPLTIRPQERGRE